MEDKVHTSSVTLATSLKQQTKQQHRDRQRKLGRQQQKKKLTSTTTTPMLEAAAFHASLTQFLSGPCINALNRSQ